MPSTSWTRIEVETVVADYLDMFEAELRGERYSKTEHRRRVQAVLGTRVEKAIEYKYQNISAALLDLRYPYLLIKGFKPKHNYQGLLREVLIEQLPTRHALMALVRKEIEKEAVVPDVDDILQRLVNPPKRAAPKESAAYTRERRRVASSGAVDWFAREARNSSLGRAGELFVIRFEKARLISEGFENLAAKVEHVAVTHGDHEGFDVLSFDAGGAERLIEVKTTAYADVTPFYVSRNQVALSVRDKSRFHLFRLFTFRTDPRIFQLKGSLEATCDLEPSEYSATPA